MNGFRTGDFDRGLVSGVLHPFLPAHAANSLHDVDLENLWAKGKRLLLIDVDNTLVAWRQENFAAPVLAWIEKAKAMGFEICILSNTRRVERLSRLSNLLGVTSVRGKFKPSRAMYRLALIKFKRKPEEAIMIGDQIFTDVLGANRAGVQAIWVRKMEGREFGPTSISRLGERILRGAMYRALVTPIDEQPAPKPIEQSKPFFERTIVRQFMKFAVVGGSSFVLDAATRTTLLFVVPFHGDLLSEFGGHWLRLAIPAIFGGFATNNAAFYPLAATAGSAIGILNSFVWNRKWTFQIRGKEGRLAELRRFVAVSVGAAILNVVVSSILNHMLPFSQRVNAAAALVIATGIGMIWNFAGQRLYAFRKRPD